MTHIRKLSVQLIVTKCQFVWISTETAKKMSLLVTVSVWIYCYLLISRLYAVFTRSLHKRLNEISLYYFTLNICLRVINSFHYFLAFFVDYPRNSVPPTNSPDNRKFTVLNITWFIKWYVYYFALRSLSDFVILRQLNDGDSKKG